MEILTRYLPDKGTEMEASAEVPCLSVWEYHTALGTHTEGELAARNPLEEADFRPSPCVEVALR